MDFYRITYFKNGNLRFPYNCPDLVNEYFDLALIEFLEKQKTVLGLLFNEKDQFNKFILNEIEEKQQRIKSQREFLLNNKRHKFESKENDIQICEGYINYLKAKKLTKPEADKLTFKQLALKLVYEGKNVTRDNSKDFLEITNLNSGDKLYNEFNFFQNTTDRKADPQSKVKLNNKIKLFEIVIDLLEEKYKPKAEDELKILKSYLSKY
jgi:hypothetical protein